MSDAFPRFREIVTAICNGRDLEEILQLVLDQACDLAKARHGSLMRVDPGTRSLVILGTVGADWSPEKKAARLKIGEGVTGTVARTGHPYRCDDTAKDPHYIALFPSIRAEVAVPVLISGEVWAVINMDSEVPSAFDASTEKLLTAFAEMVSFAIEAHLANEWFGEKDLETLMRELGGKGT